MRHSGCVATAVDRQPANLVPHYEEAGMDVVRYRQLDILSNDAVSVMHAWSLDRGGPWAERPVAVLGMHLCGRLSEQAVELFRCCNQARACVLSPCCLPHMHDAPVALQPLYRRRQGLGFETQDREQYQGWCEHLRLLLSAVPGVRVESFQASEMISTKNTMLVAMRDSAGC